MGKVIVTGAAGMLGQRLIAVLAADPNMASIVGIDHTSTAPATRSVVESIGSGRAKVRFEAISLNDPELKRVCDAATTIVYLGESMSADDASASLDGTSTKPVSAEAMRHLLDVAADVGVTSVVVLSSALVYGAWPNNPVPLTEDAPLRPDSALLFAIERTEIERVVSEWRDDRAVADEAAITVAVLRPTITVDHDSGPWLARSPWSTVGVQVHDAEPPVQFLHLDDLVSAVDLACCLGLDGTFNVAPDGWIPAEQLRALRGPAPRVHVPAVVAERVAAVRWRFGMTGTPPSVLPYTMHSWVVSNDRLRAAGWEPKYSNEEAYVEADRGGIVASLNPRRRQLLSIGAVGGTAATLAAGALILIRRRTKKSDS